MFVRLPATISARIVKCVSVSFPGQSADGGGVRGATISDDAPAGSDRLDRDVLSECGEGFDVLFVAGEDGAAGLGQCDDDRVDS